MNKWLLHSGPGASGYSGESCGIPDVFVELDLSDNSGCYFDGVLIEENRVYQLVANEKDNSYIIKCFSVDVEARKAVPLWSVVEPLEFDIEPSISLFEGYLITELVVYDKYTGERKLEALKTLSELGEFAPAFVRGERFFRHIDIENPEKSWVSIDIFSKDVTNVDCHDGGCIEESTGYLICHGHGRLYAFDILKNLCVWDYTIERNEVEAAPIYAALNAKVFIVRGNNLDCLDAESGQRISTFNYYENTFLKAFDLERKKELGADSRMQVANIYTDGVIVIIKGVLDWVVCYDSLLGQLLWEKKPYFEAENLIEMAIAGRMVFTGVNKFGVAWDLHTGDEIWRSPTKVLGNKVSIGDRVAIYHSTIGEFDVFVW